MRQVMRAPAVVYCLRLRASKSKSNSAHAAPKNTVLFTAIRRAAWFLVVFLSLTGAANSSPSTIAERLKSLSVQKSYGVHVNDNWEIFVMNADGSHPVNLTSTPRSTSITRKFTRRARRFASQSIWERAATPSAACMSWTATAGIGGTADHAREPSGVRTANHRLPAPGISQVQRDRLLHEGNELL